MAQELKKKTRTKTIKGKAATGETIKSNESRDQSLQDVVKTEQTSEKTSQVADGRETTTSSLNKFWEEFRLSPVHYEHVIQTNMGWLALITLGPLALLVGLWTIYVMLYYKSIGQNFVARYAFTDLNDPIFTLISLPLFFGAVIFCYRWYPALRQAFDSLLENDVLRTKEGKKLTTADFLGFLEDYRRNLHSRRRYLLPIVFILLTLGVSFFILTSRGAWDLSHINEPLELVRVLHLIPRWVLAPILWSLITTLWFWTLIATTKAIMDLTPRFQINVQPLHSDRAGGLKKLGDLSSNVGLLIVVVATSAIVLAIQGTIQSIKVASCGEGIQQFITGQTSMTQDQLTDCIYIATVRYYKISRADISDYMAKQLGNGISLKEIATDYYNNSEGFFERQAIFTNYFIFYAMDFVLLILLMLSFYVVIRPLFDIHKSMVEYKLKRERETNRHVSQLFDEMTTLIKENKFEEADKVKANMKLLRDELSEIQKYPRWPISSLPVLRSYLTSSVLTALVTYVINLLKLSVSEETGAVVNAIIKSIFGQ